VSWRHRIAVVLLTVLAGLPVSGTVCTMMCDSASSQAPSRHHDSAGPSHHHDSGKGREDVAAASTGLQLRGVSDHDCSTHDGAVRQLITTTAQRGDALVIATPLAGAIVQISFATPSGTNSAFDYSAPPGTAPPTTTPLVLRV